MPDLTNTIVEEAARPKRSESDGQVAEGHSLTELIAADKYLKGQAADTVTPVRSGWGRVRMAHAVPPGAAPQ